jgi:hypothetical protein
VSWQWQQKAYCRKSENTKFWLSFDLDEIEQALHGCSICEVSKQCAKSYAQYGGQGVIAGTTDFDRLMSKWRKAVDVNDNNWS